MPIARASMPVVTPGLSHDDAPCPPREHGRIRRLQPRSECGSAVTLSEFLEAEDYGYVIRLPANAVLQRRIAHLLKRPVGRPPHEVRRYYASFRYQAQTWSTP